MKQNNYPPHNPNPYGPDWPDANFHPDWPHYRHMHAWNDTEPAAVVPWPEECCPEPYDDCVCVTSGDIDLWNKISAVSAFADINIDGLSGLSALSGIGELIPACDLVSTYSGVWMSAEYVPTIFEDISAMSAKIDTKAPLSGEYMQHIYSDPDYFDGLGTRKSSLRPSQYLRDAIDLVDASSEGFTKRLVNVDECDKVEKSINDLYDRTVRNTDSITDLYKKVNKGGGKSADWTNQKVTLEESKNNPDIFYYYDSKMV